MCIDGDDDIAWIGAPLPLLLPPFGGGGPAIGGGPMYPRGDVGPREYSAEGNGGPNKDHSVTTNSSSTDYQ